MSSASPTFPPEAQQKLFARKHFRDRVVGNALKLFDTSVDDAGFGS